MLFQSVLYLSLARPPNEGAYKQIILIATDAHYMYFASYWNDNISNEMLII